MEEEEEKDEEEKEEEEKKKKKRRQRRRSRRRDLRKVGSRMLHEVFQVSQLRVVQLTQFQSAGAQTDRESSSTAISGPAPCMTAAPTGPAVGRSLHNRDPSLRTALQSLERKRKTGDKHACDDANDDYLRHTFLTCHCSVSHSCIHACPCHYDL